MNKSLKLIRIGNSTGVILPKDLLQSLGADTGDSLFTVRTPAGIEIRRSEPDSAFERQMAVAREVMMRRRKALGELAK
jgi:putative addiction module antidote